MKTSLHNNMKRLFVLGMLVIMVMTCPQHTYAQNNVGINIATPDPSAALDVKSASGLNQGILPTFVDLATATFPSPGPATGLLVHNSNSAYGQGTGIYQNIGTPVAPIWLKQITKNDAWGLLGNTGTNAVTNFIGTTDNNDAVIRRNASNFSTQFIQLTGAGLGISATSPTDNTNSGKSLFFGQSGNITGTSGLDIGIDNDNNSTNSNFRIIKDAATELVRVQEDGSVGINQPSPAEKLDIKDGNIKLSTTTQNQKTSGQLQFTAAGIATTTKMVVVRKTVLLTTSSTTWSANVFDDGYMRFGTYYNSGSGRWVLAISPYNNQFYDYNYLGGSENNARTYYYTDDGINNYVWSYSGYINTTSPTPYEIAGVPANPTWDIATGGSGSVYAEGTTTTNPYYEFNWFITYTSTTTQRLITVVIKAYY